MKKNFGTLLVDRNLVSEKVLSEALQRQIIFGGRLGTNLIEMGAVSEEAVLKLLSSQHGIPYATAEHFDHIPQATLNSIPNDLLEKFRIIPIKMEKNTITLAMEDPTRLDVVDEVGFQVDKVIKPVVASELRITYALEHYYGIRRKARFIQAGPLPSSPPAPDAAELVELREEDLAPEEIQELAEIHIEPLNPLDVTEINKALWAVQNRDDVAQALIRACLRVMDDAFMFILKGDSTLGWLAGGSLAPPAHFGAWQRTIEPGDVFGVIREARAVQRDAGQALYAANPWLDDFSVKAPNEIIACPLVLRKHTVSAVLGFCWDRNLDDEEIEFLVRIMKKASVALEVLILKSRILML